MIRVCIVEDQTLVRRGLQYLLELADDIAVVATAVDGEEAPRVIAEARPDVVLLDMRLPKANGIAVLRSLELSGDLPPTIILTTFDEDDAVLQGIRAGAKGYLLKDVSLEQLTTAIRTVADGGTFINPTVTERVLHGLRKRPLPVLVLDPSIPAEALTPRETEILRFMAGGYSNYEIAQALGVSEGTIKNHVSNVLGKLSVRDRTRAVLKAVQYGYI
jgi:DNA-binding NarL/FixJ family response regulator